MSLINNTTLSLVMLPAFRSGLADFLCDHTLRVLAVNTKHMGVDYSPFPPSVWQSWENLIAATPKKVQDAKVQRPKKVADPQNPKKKIKDPAGGFELVDAKLKEPVSVSTDLKNALLFVIGTFIQEAQQSVPALTKSDVDSIKDTIVNTAASKSEYVVSELLFAIAASANQTSLNGVFNNLHGKFKGKLTEAVEKAVNNSTVQAIVIDTILTFLKVYVLHMGATVWFNLSTKKPKSEKKTADGEEDAEGDADETDEAATDGDDESDTPGGASKKFNAMLFKQWLMSQDLSNIEIDDSRLNAEFYDAMDQFVVAVADADKARTAANKAKKAAADAAKAAAGTTTVNAAAATAEVDPDDTTSELPAAVAAPVAAAPVTKAPRGKKAAATSAPATTSPVQPVASTAAPPVAEPPAPKPAGTKRRTVVA